MNKVIINSRIGRAVCYFLVWLAFTIMLIALSMAPFVRRVDGGDYYVILIIFIVVILIAFGSHISQHGYFSSRSWLSHRLKWLTGNENMLILKAGKKKEKEFFTEEHDSMVYSYRPSEKRFYITRTMYLNPLRYEKEYKARKSQIELRLEQTPIRFDWNISDCDSILSFTVTVKLKKGDATKENVCCLRDALKDLAKDDFEEHLFSKLMFDEGTVYLEFHHYNLIRMVLDDTNGHIERYSPLGASEEPSEHLDEIIREIYEDNRMERLQPDDLIEADEFERIWRHTQRQ